MKLNQALKQKSRLAGELVRLQTIFSRENARRSDSVSQIERGDVWKKIEETSALLSDLKGKITVANIGIYPKLELMAELKSKIAYLNMLSKREGTELESLGYNATTPITYTWNSYINQSGADDMIAKLQVKINDLQDEIDSWNATTEI